MGFVRTIYCMEASHTRKRRKSKSAQQRWFDRPASARVIEERGKGWQAVTERFEREFSPDLWVTLETVQPVPYKRGKRLVRAFWSKVCRKYKCHAEIMLFSDQQPNSTYSGKHDYHHFVRWIDGTVPNEAIGAMWQAFLNKRLFAANKDKELDINDMAVRDYVANIQPYQKRVETHAYNHCFKYAWTGHEWHETFIACPHTGQCKKKGCRYRNRD